MVWKVNKVFSECFIGVEIRSEVRTRFAFDSHDMIGWGRRHLWEGYRDDTEIYGIYAYLLIDTSQLRFKI